MWQKIIQFNRPLYKVPTLSIQNSKFNVIKLKKKKVLNQKISANIKENIAVHLHLYYEDLIHEILDRLKNLKYPFDIYVSTQSSIDLKKLEIKLKKELPTVKKIVIKILPNRGMDLGPFIISFGQELLNYDIVGHFHTKKSSHLNCGKKWYLHILDSLLGSQKDGSIYINAIINIIREKNALIYPDYFLKLINSKDGWEDDKEYLKTMIKRYTKINLNDYPIVEYTQGSMFWSSSENIKPFLTLPITFRSFLNKPKKSNALEHVLERLILIYASQSNTKLIRIID